MTLCVDPDISSHVRARTCEFTLIARFRSRNIISSFAWISQFTALAVSDCAKLGNQKATQKRHGGQRGPGLVSLGRSDCPLRQHDLGSIAPGMRPK